MRLEQRLVTDRGRDDAAGAGQRDLAVARDEVRQLVGVQVLLRVDDARGARLEHDHADAHAGVPRCRRADADRDAQRMAQHLEDSEPRVVGAQREASRMLRLVTEQRELGKEHHFRAVRGGLLDPLLVRLDVPVDLARGRLRLYDGDAHGGL